jgi:alpha/beta superfamily hydrolase
VDPTAASVGVTTPDGITLAADLAVPADARAGAVVLHPHPRYGGDRFNSVVDALFRALPAAGIAALRFDFRPGAGADGSDLAGERRDVGAALDELIARLPGRPLFVVGYSFGAVVGLGLEHSMVTARVAIAPPLAMMTVGPPASGERTLVLVPAADQFSPPETIAPIVADWPETTVEVIDSADHFLVGRAEHTAARAVGGLTAQH